MAVEHPRFAHSRTRPQLVTALWSLCACLCRWGVGEELWVDGSLLTEKIDPEDIDLVLVIPENFEGQASDAQFGIWDWWDDRPAEIKGFFRCDTFSVAKIPMGDPNYPHYLFEETKWKKFFGTSRDGEAKGIGRILLPGGCQ